MKFGDFQLFVVSDGMFRLDGGAMFGVVPRVLWEKTDAPDQRNRILLGLNCLLIDTGEERVLVDTGIGNKFDEKFATIYGIDKSVNLLDSLRKVGVSAEEITRVVLTHLHFDHCGGNTVRDEEGRLRPTFPNARYYVQRGELEYAMDPDPRSKASYLPENWEPLQQAGILEVIEGNQTIVPGIETFVTGGHTGDHQIVLVRSGGQTACFLGDLCPTTSHVRLPYVMSYDLYPKQTMEMKDRVLRQALDEHWLLIFEHAPRIAAGYLKEVDGKFQVDKVEINP
jgi:glyoxylase-like metal-dependent hydrolase (beta-lactamase superfamily II)